MTPIEGRGLDLGRRVGFRLPLAVADQFGHAGTSFALMAVLSRASGMEEVGRYSVAYAGVILVFAIHSALVMEPIFIELGTASLRRRLATGLEASNTSLLFAIVLAVVPVLASWVTGRDWELAASAGAVALLGSHSGFLRRLLYSESTPRVAAPTIISMPLISLLAIFLLPRNAFGAMLSLSAGYAASIVVGHALSGSRPQGISSTCIRSAISAGRPFVGVHILAWIPVNIYFVLGGTALLSLNDAGVARAMLSLSMPILQVSGAASVLILSRRKLVSRLAGRRNATRASAVIAALAFVSAVVSPIALRPLFHAVFGASIGVDSAAFNLLGWFIVVAGTSPLITNAAKALGHVRALVRLYGLVVIVALSLGVSLAYNGGHVGVLVALSLNATIVGMGSLLIIARFPLPRMPEPME